MFAAFFYLLRQRGLDVSLNEWMTLLEGMEKGLHHSTLTGFYHLCRAVVVKSETEFDRFDQVFLEFFKDVPYTGELPEELMNWLNHPSDDLRRTVEELRGAGFPEEDLENYDTINGLLISRLDRIPGDDEQPEIQYLGYRFCVLKVENKMIHSVRVTKLPQTLASEEK